MKITNVKAVTLNALIALFPEAAHSFSNCLVDTVKHLATNKADISLRGRCSI